LCFLSDVFYDTNYLLSLFSSYGKQEQEQAGVHINVWSCERWEIRAVQAGLVGY
jgi:hypothetical protein